jgi:hypothetical protein
VPNFGQDHDIRDSLSHTTQSEENLNHQWNFVAKKDRPAPHPVDYKVPNFGLDHEILTTQANIAVQEAKHGSWTPVQDDEGFWIVPGAADNASYTYRGSSLVQTDAQSDPICPSSGCNYATAKGKATHPMNYFVPNFGVDHDIKDSLAHTMQSEDNLKHRWNVVPKEDRPKGHPVDYKVANFGVDEDVKVTLANVKREEKRLKHVWTPT